MDTFFFNILKAIRQDKLLKKTKMSITGVKSTPLV